MAEHGGRIPTFQDVRAAAVRLAGKAVRTPLLLPPVLAERVGARVAVKPETLQRTGSFKFRGAYNALASMPEAERGRGVVTCSSGNHAQGLAAAAAIFGVSATIVMPNDAPALKRQRTRGHGAEIVSYDRATGDRDAIAAEISERTGALFVAPYDDPAVIAGQGSVGIELIEQAGSQQALPDIVLVPAGGGGLAAGIALALEGLAPQAQLYTVEPEGFDDHARSFASGQREANPSRAGSLCDSLLAERPGALTFAVTRRRAAGGLVVSDQEALDAVAFAWRELKLVVEPGGAVALAALMAGRIDVQGRHVACILSGGNADPAIFSQAVAATVS